MDVAVKIETYSELPHDKIMLVSVDEVIAYLNSDPQQDTVNQLYDFGKLLLDHVRGLRNSNEAKLTSCLGWGTAILAIMLAGITQWVNTGWVHTLACWATTLALVSVIAATIGLKSWAGWKWPSEKDWFQSEFFSCSDRLKRSHLIAMLEVHQNWSRRVQKKGYALMIAEYALVASAISLGVAVIFRQII